jgi:glycosyltransferase involved in cell wall biosynthesis
MRVAYLVNHYPKVSHSFVRREIHALERQGLQVLRLAARGWDDASPDASDQAERAVTRHVLAHGGLPLVAALVRTLVCSPLRLFGAVRLALQCSRGSDRPWPVHLVYVAQACRFLEWIREAGVQHVHAHFGTNPAEVAMLIEALGGPGYSFTVHGPEEFDRPQALGLARKIARARFVVAISSFGRSQLYRWADAVNWPRVEVVHCGLEPGFHRDAPALSAPVARLVCVGRLCEQKGQLLLVQAVDRLVREGVEVRLVLAGDGEMRPAIESWIAERRLQEHVQITGWIDGARVREEILAARALVLPSFAEGLPVVLMEALALRRPVLSTYVAGIPELVVPGESGWLVPAGDVDALADALRTCLAADLPTLHRMGEAGRRRVLERHSVDTEAAKLAALFVRHAAVDSVSAARAEDTHLIATGSSAAGGRPQP